MTDLHAEAVDEPEKPLGTFIRSLVWNPAFNWTDLAKRVESEVLCRAGVEQLRQTLLSIQHLWNCVSGSPCEVARLVICQLDEKTRRLESELATLRTDASLRENELRRACELNDNLKSQLPDGMKDCTILFKECDKGHGWLTATNWVQHGCPTCEIDKLKSAAVPTSDKPCLDIDGNVLSVGDVVRVVKSNQHLNSLHEYRINNAIEGSLDLQYGDMSAGVWRSRLFRKVAAPEKTLVPWSLSDLPSPCWVKHKAATTVRLVIESWKDGIATKDSNILWEPLCDQYEWNDRPNAIVFRPCGKETA